MKIVWWVFTQNWFHLRQQEYFYLDFIRHVLLWYFVKDFFFLRKTVNFYLNFIWYGRIWVVILYFVFGYPTYTSLHPKSFAWFSFILDHNYQWPVDSGLSHLSVFNLRNFYEAYQGCNIRQFKSYNPPYRFLQTIRNLRRKACSYYTCCSILLYWVFTFF